MQGDQPISDGKVAGDDISFVVVANFQGNEIQVELQGKSLWRRDQDGPHS
jgi:hypothetical protein